MKKAFKFVFSLLAAAACAAAAGCADGGKSTLLGKPATPSRLTYEEQSGKGFKEFIKKVEKFAGKFAESAYKNFESSKNTAYSPISAYMALGLAAECADGETRKELLSALGCDYAELKEYYSVLYRSLEVEHKRADSVTGVLNLSNSIWINEGTQVNSSCIDSLSNGYYAYSYSADFLNGNAAANRAVRSFVKDRTKGLIDKDFELSEQTLFALINTLYLKTVWNEEGEDIGFTDKKYTFVQGDGSEKTEKLLQGYYKSGRVYEGENYKTFYTSSYDGYKIKFILPADGRKLDDVMNAETLYEVSKKTDYNAYDDVNKIHYNTRCLFPEYRAEFDEEISKILKNDFNLKTFFSSSCDFSALTDESVLCSAVKHVTDLTVDKKGIEGAAVTVIGMDATSPAPGEKYEEVYSDFVVDGAFAYIISDYNNVTLFSGVVNYI